MLQTLILPIKFITDTDYWLLSRSAAIVGFLFLWGAVLTGILIKTKLFNDSGLNVQTRKAHYTMAKSGFYFSLFHVLILRYDRYARYNFRQLLLPILGNTSVFPLEIGKWALYGLIVIGISFFAFKKKRCLAHWAHLLSYPIFFLGLAHGLILGTDTTTNWMLFIYGITAATVALAIIYYIVSLFDNPLKI